jgi:hypothetical protein
LERCSPGKVCRSGAWSVTGREGEGTQVHRSEVQPASLVGKEQMHCTNLREADSWRKQCCDSKCLPRQQNIQRDDTGMFGSGQPAIQGQCCRKCLLWESCLISCWHLHISEVWIPRSQSPYTFNVSLAIRLPHSPHLTLSFLKPLLSLHYDSTFLH